MASVRVAVRVRPMDRREKDLTAKCIIKMEGTKTSITNLKIPDGIGGDSMRDRTKTFTYDFSYDSSDSHSSKFVSQEKVFRDLGVDVLKAAFEGYNACVFAYGQTGSGKSYTMMGNPGDAGLIPRICEGLFSRISDATRWDVASFRTEVSYLEIYNERVRDLLRRKSTQTYNLRVREHPKDGPYVEDLSKHLVQNYSDVEELMEAGNLNRTTASTGMNDVSSRSHAIFTVNFTQAKFDAQMPSETVSKIHLVDLAGSERADATGATGVRLKEGGNINKSLVTLGNVISALADMTQDGLNTNLKKKSVFVPYRDSVLTWLLKDSLGGNSKTIMIATVSPADVNYGETLSTLRYANRAKNIINKPTINEDSNVRLIGELRAEIARLKALLIQGNQIALLDSPTALSMEEKLHQNEARVLELTKEWTNKWNETQNILKEETLALRKEGIGVVLDSELPHLIGIDDDLLSTGIILYHLKEGRTYVGREDASTEQDIILHGLDLESEHCMFQNQNGTVTLVPLGEAQCSVNGVQVMEPMQLNQGAVILLGRTNMFRFNHPKEAAKLREKRKSGLLSTFSLSMSDLSKSCENLSTVMLYNPGLFTQKGPVFLRLEFERQQREELEKLELKRRLIKEMEAKQQSEKAELERLQQEVESQRKESEEVHQRILCQEESLRRRSQDIESRLRDFLVEKMRFEEERRSEVQGEELQWRGNQQLVGEAEEEQRLQQEAAEQTEIYRELKRLKREREEQKVRLEAERRRLEKEEREQLSLVGRLEEQLRDKQEAATTLLTRDDSHRLEEERQALAEIRGVLLRAKEAGERPDVEDTSEEAGSAQARYTEFKAAQVKELGLLEEGLQQQRERLEKEVTAERNTVLLLTQGLKERQQLLKEMQEKRAQDTTVICQEEQLVKQAELRLRFKERQLANLCDRLLPALAEEKQRASEVLERGSGNCPAQPELDNTLYQVEKELEDKEEKLKLHLQRAQQLLQLQETYEFTANVARQEEKVRRKEKEILESKEKQQREAMEEAVARLERRHSALRRCVSMEPHIEEQRNLRRAELDQQRVEQEIQRLRQRINEGEENNKNHSVNNEERSLSTLLPLSDDRINAYIEEEVQRRLRQMNLLKASSSSSSVVDLCGSCDSLREDEEEVSACSSVRVTDEDEEKLHDMNPRRHKYERARTPEPHFLTSQEVNSPTKLKTNSAEDSENLLLTLLPEENLLSRDEASVRKEVSHRELSNVAWLQGGDDRRLGEDVDRSVNEPDDSANTEDRSSGQNITESEEYDDVDGSLNQTFDLGTKEDTQLVSCLSLETQDSVGGCITAKETKPESQSKHKNVATNRSYHLGYLVGKLSDLYKDAGKKLQDTRDLIQRGGVSEMKDALSHYVSMVSKELPLLHHMQLKIPSKGLSECILSPPQKSCRSVTVGITAWPEGSLFLSKNTSPQVFHQRLVELPPPLSQLQNSSPSEMMDKLESLSPQIQVRKCLSVFWMKVANNQQPIPKPGCLLVSRKDITVVSAGSDSANALVLFHHLNLSEITKMEVSLAGQHVRLLGCSEDAVLAVFTHSKDLTQEFCKVVLDAVAPGRFHEGPENHPLLSDDLMVLSLNWKSGVPDLVLGCGLRVTSRFKRVLADLLYIVHGNMDDRSRPSLANVCPLLYTSVKVMNPSWPQQDAISQFLLTDTHVTLLCEDSVFRPVPRGSTLVPVQPQFHRLEVRKRSDVRTLIVKQKDGCVVVELVFSTLSPQEQEAECGPSPADDALTSDSRGQCRSWRLCFGCTSDAVMLMDHLCT
ncbi:kinesin-like protein KIF16B isoform X1 [Solea solea]|uniref:kinesin-like protein KIF16B isoform X1 n=1 Tax=Solea solea TaxID=90069 RepID=UPI00272CFD6E|nr:kinesin-like protein KIF16B isoform X1 [Solea solea]